MESILSLMMDTLYLVDRGFESMPLLTSHPIKIDLSRNKIKVINQIDPLIRVESICFLNNMIEEFYLNAPHLRELNLCKNKLKVLNTNMFELLENLNMLLIEKNAIHEVRTFASLLNLTHLSLYHNNIQHLHEDVFIELVNLQALNLENNNLKMFDVRGLRHLSVLILNTNKIQDIRCFTKYTSLESLDLGNNVIEYLPSLRINSLKHLYVDHNKIKCIKIDTFENMQNLMTLDLRSNEISRLEFAAFSQLNMLRVMYISNMLYFEFTLFNICAKLINTNIIKQISKRSYTSNDDIIAQFKIFILTTHPNVKIV